MPAAAPLVTVGLPVYNGARFLAETLADWGGQSFGDFELLIADNASTDGTEALCREAAARDPRVRYVRHARNIGALPNANFVAAQARGRLFVLSAHDDRRAPDFLDTLVAALDADPEAVLAYGRSTLIGADGRPFRWDADARVHRDAAGRAYDYDQALERPLTDGASARFRAVLFSNDVNAPVHGLFRTDALRRTGGHQFAGSDRRLVAHAALLGRFAFVDRPLFGYRLHEDSTLFLDRAAWAARETGDAHAADARATLRSFAAYWRTVGAADLPPAVRARAYAATLAYAVRPARLARALVPGPDNYFGLRRWPWERAGGGWAVAPEC